MTSGEVRTILKTGVVLGTGGVVLDWLADQTGDDVALYVNNGADAENPEGVRATSTVSYARCMINLP